ncbi:NUDIX domain-containing protein [Streptomyces sp. NPDC059875]|uniref:NUDIX domain-containing protein n=1 Tax=unclassified Streptomyces TaxID=2593676 RepID=UPI003652CA38
MTRLSYRHWPAHSRETLLDTPSYRIHRDHVTQPDGGPGTFEWHESTCDGAVIVAVNDADEIALVRYTTYVHGEILTLPGGTLEPGETPLDAATREVAEEAGVTAGTWTKLGETALMTKCSARLHMFAARDLTIGQQRLTGTETGMKVEWLPLNEAVDAALNGRLTLAGSALAVLAFAQLLGRESA